MHIGPNPATDFVVITFNVPGIETLTVKLFDLNGQQIIERPGTHSGDRVDVSRLQRGIYGIKLLAPDGTVVGVTKVLKL